MYNNCSLHKMLVRFIEYSWYYALHLFGKELQEKIVSKSVLCDGSIYNVTSFQEYICVFHV
jgi:hypothetical protein